MKMERVSHMPLMPGHGTGAVTQAYQGQTGGSHNEADGLCCRDLLAINGGFNGTIVMGVAVPPECCGHVLTMTEVNTYADWIVVSISAHCLPKKNTCAACMRPITLCLLWHGMTMVMTAFAKPCSID